MSSPCLVSKGVCWFQTGGAFPVWQCQSLRQCRGPKRIMARGAGRFRSSVFVAKECSHATFFLVSLLHVLEFSDLFHSLSIEQQHQQQPAQQAAWTRNQQSHSVSPGSELISTSTSTEFRATFHNCFDSRGAQHEIRAYCNPLSSHSILFVCSSNAG